MKNSSDRERERLNRELDAAVKAAELAALRLSYAEKRASELAHAAALRCDSEKLAATIRERAEAALAQCRPGAMSPERKAEIEREHRARVRRPDAWRQKKAVERHRGFLKSVRWVSEIRPEALERAGFACERCGAEDGLEVHHITYDRFGGAELPADLEALCRACHGKRHW